MASVCVCVCEVQFRVSFCGLSSLLTLYPSVLFFFPVFYSAVLCLFSNWSRCSLRRGLAKGEPKWPFWGKTLVFSSETSRWASGWARCAVCQLRRNMWVQRGKSWKGGHILCEHTQDSNACMYSTWKDMKRHRSMHFYKSQKEWSCMHIQTAIVTQTTHTENHISYLH